MGTDISYPKPKKKDQNSTFENQKLSSKEHHKATNPPIVKTQNMGHSVNTN